MDGIMCRSKESLVLKLLLDEILGSDKLPDVFVISPFAEIPHKLKVKLQKSLQEVLKPDKENSNILHDWLKSHVGTVHTFQGKQASGDFCVWGLMTNPREQLLGFIETEFVECSLNLG